jgi:hypothetical protein
MSKKKQKTKNMKNLLKLLIICLMFTTMSNSFAQKFGIKAGLNLSLMTLKDNDGNLFPSSKMNPGFHVGVTAEFPLVNQLAFETGLLFCSKGTKAIETGGTNTVNSLYLEVPLNLKTTFNIGNKTKMYGTFGPYLGYGVGGKYKFTSDTLNTSTKIKWGSGNNSDLKPFDFGLSVGLGVYINKLQVGVSYELGLKNIATDTQNGNINRNKVLGISLGWKF